MGLRRHWPCLVVLALYLVLAVLYSLASPLYEPTDELRHFRYVRHLAVYRSLPVQQPDEPRAQSHHPPLYYVLGALVSGWVPVEQGVYDKPAENPFWGYRQWEVGDDNKNQYLHRGDERFPYTGITLAVYMVRWMTVLMGAGIVWLTYRAGRDLFPDWPALAAGAAALLAFNPQFLYLSGAINNDIPATLCSAAVLWVCILMVRDGPGLRTDVALGVLFGLALLTKFNLLALLALIELAYAIAAWRSRSWRALVRGHLVVLGLVTLISGWWFWRNQVLYSDPTGMRMVNELWAGRSVSEGWWAIRQGLPYLWSSLWGRFGYGQVPMPQAVYEGLLVFCGLALAGCLLPRRGVQVSAATALLVVMPLVFAAVVFYYMAIQPAGAMGRFLFPGLPAFYLLLVAGLSRFFSRRFAWAAGSAVAAGMIGLAIYALVCILAPAFARPRLLSEAQVEPYPARVEFGFPVEMGQGGVVELLDARVEPDAVEPGGVVRVTATWQVLARTDRDCVVFVHLLSDVGTMIAQRDTYPGLGRYPTTAWDAGVIFSDVYRLHVPETAYAPDEGYVQIGMFLPDGPRLVTPDGRDAARLAPIQIQPRPGEFPNGLDANFGDRIALVGYTLDRRVVRPGETIRLTLYWRALASMERDYQVFAHVLGVGDQLWANTGGHPGGGSAPTSAWEPSQVVEDGYELTVGLTAPPDFYDIEVGLFIPGEGRLPVLAEGGHWLDDRVLLSKVRVVADE